MPTMPTMPTTALLAILLAAARLAAASDYPASWAHVTSALTDPGTSADTYRDLIGPIASATSMSYTGDAGAHVGAGFSATQVRTPEVGLHAVYLRARARVLRRGRAAKRRCRSDGRRGLRGPAACGLHRQETRFRATAAHARRRSAVASMRRRNGPAR